MIDKSNAKVNWYPGTSKAATEQGYEVVDQSGDSHFAVNRQSPENRGYRGAAQPLVDSEGGDFIMPGGSEYVDD
jgi:hypothetical protein